MLDCFILTGDKPFIFAAKLSNEQRLHTPAPISLSLTFSLTLALGCDTPTTSMYFDSMDSVPKREIGTSILRIVAVWLQRLSRYNQRRGAAVG